MANNFPPGVTAKQGIVELGKSIAFSSLFDVFDLDQGSVVERVRFRDDGALATSGFFTVNGIRQNANQWVEIDYANLASVDYYAALTIENESFNVQVYDGQFWSNVDNNIIFSVTPNDDPVVISTTTGTVLAYEERTLDGLFTAEDPDGFPIEFYYLIDRTADAFGGFLTVNGIRKESGRWFRIEAAELENVRYVAAQTTTPTSETIGVMAFDGAIWSSPEDVRVHTIPNRHDPEMTVFNTKSAPNRSFAFSTLSNWVDPDGNTAKRYGFLDNGTEANSGYFTIDGVRQDSGRWITFDASIVDRVRYNTSTVSSEEEVFIGVFDGRYWSQPASNTIASIARPVVEVVDHDIRFNELERISVSTLYTQAGDPGPDFETYEVYDTNPDTLSGGFWIGSTELQNGVWHTLTREQFLQLEFQGAESDLDRTTDEMLVRGFNGRFWSEVERINVTSDPVGHRALESGTDWGHLSNGTTTVITYSFIDGHDPGPDPNYPPLPIYYAPPDVEAVDTYPLANNQRADVRIVLNDIEKHVNIDFVEVPYDITAPSTLIFGTHTDVPNILGHAYFPTNIGDGISSRPGDVWYNNADVFGEFDPRNNPVVGPGSNFRVTTIHEIGHALGLKHPFQGLPALPLSVDKSYNTTMAYITDTTHHPDEPSTVMIWDIEHLQQDYGRVTSYNPGNDHYFFDNSDLQALPSDTGGIDTLNFTNHLLNESIDLREGRWSSLNGVANSLIIPYEVEIENARGGRGNDTIQGNEIRNRLWGNEGDDTFIGGGGNDLLRGGAGDDTYVWRIGDNRDTIMEEGSGGTDVVEFHDNTLRLNSLVDDFVFYRLGNDLRIDLTLDRGQAFGSTVIKDFDNSLSSVETLKLFDESGRQIDEDIDLNSVFVQATSRATRFRRTEIMGANGFIAVPEV